MPVSVNDFLEKKSRLSLWFLICTKTCFSLKPVFWSDKWNDRFNDRRELFDWILISIAADFIDKQDALSLGVAGRKVGCGHSTPLAPNPEANGHLGDSGSSSVGAAADEQSKLACRGADPAFLFWQKGDKHQHFTGVHRCESILLNLYE